MNREVCKTNLPETRGDDFKLNELSRVKDVFLDLLSQDLKGSMNVILNYSELLLTRGRSLTQIQQDEYVNEVYHTALQTVNLVDNLLLWSQLKMRKITSKPEVFQALEVISDLLFQIKSESKSGDVLFFDEFVSDEWIKADLSLFSKVLRILVHNAMQNSPEYGKVYIRMYKQADNLIVEIEDQGPSIPIELIGHDSLISGSCTTINQVAMLSLVVSRDLVELNNGQMMVSAVSGKFNRIGFTVPLASESEVMNVFEEIKRETN